MPKDQTTTTEKISILVEQDECVYLDRDDVKKILLAVKDGLLHLAGEMNFADSHGRTALNHVEAAFADIAQILGIDLGETL